MSEQRFKPWNPIKNTPFNVYVEALHDDYGGVQLFVRGAGGVLQADRLTHYAIHTQEDCVDVVTEFEPEVVWLDEGPPRGMGTAGREKP